jgi:type III restriction enzyme
LIDAIEAGLVKIPRVPVDDNARQSDDLPTYRGLWLRIRDDLPKKGRKTDAVDGQEPSLPAPLEGAIQSLYGNYEKAFHRWTETTSGIDGSTPPVFIAVCNNTNVSKLVFDYISRGGRSHCPAVTARRSWFRGSCRCSRTPTATGGPHGRRRSWSTRPSSTPVTR